MLLFSKHQGCGAGSELGASELCFQTYSLNTDQT